MTALRLRLPAWLHRAAGELATREGCSLNQLIITALAEKLAALATESYIAERAARASKERCARVLGRIPE